MMRVVFFLVACARSDKDSTVQSENLRECFVDPPESAVASSNIGRCVFRYHDCDALVEAYQQNTPQIELLTEADFRNRRGGCRVMSTWAQGIDIQNEYGDEAQRIPMIDLIEHWVDEPMLRPLLITEVDALSNGDECIDEQYLSTDGETAMAIVEASGVIVDNLADDPDYQFDPFQLGWSTDLCRSLMLSKIAFDFQELGYPPTIESSCWVDSEGTPEQLSDLSVMVFTRYRYTLEEGDPFMLLQHAVDNALFYSENYDGGVPQERLSRISELAESECP